MANWFIFRIKGLVPEKKSVIPVDEGRMTAARRSLRSLSNHGDDVNENFRNLHIWRWKTKVLHALHVHSSFLTFRRRSRSFYDVKWLVLQLGGQREHVMTNVQFCLLPLKRWFQFNSRIVKHILPAQWLWIVEKWLQNREVTFSDDDLAVVYVVFA